VIWSNREGSGLGLFRSSIPSFLWRGWGKPRKTSVEWTGLRSKVWTHGLPNMKQKCQLLDLDNQYGFVTVIVVQYFTAFCLLVVNSAVFVTVRAQLNYATHCIRNLSKLEGYWPACRSDNLGLIAEKSVWGLWC